MAIKNSTIMIIDDTKLIRDHLSIKISTEFNIVYEKNGIKALSHIHKFKPDTFVIQLMLSQMDSLEICDRIRSNRELDNPVIVVVSSTGYRKSIEDVALKSGANHVLFSPFEKNKLEELISGTHTSFPNSQNSI